MEKETVIEDASFPSHVTKTKIEGEWWLLTNEENDKKFFNPITNISSEWYGYKNCHKFDSYTIEDKWFIIKLINHRGNPMLKFFDSEIGKNISEFLDYGDYIISEYSNIMRWFILSTGSEKYSKKCFYNPEHEVSTGRDGFHNIVMYPILKEKNIIALEDTSSIHYRCFLQLDTGKRFGFAMFDLDRCWYKIDDKLNTLIFTKKINYPSWFDKQDYYEEIYCLDTMESSSKRNY
jgi:hypothetical protein